MRFKVVTLGCKVNQYESQYIRTVLLKNNWEEALSKEEEADHVFINTCTVTAESDAKSRKLISRMHHENPKAALFVLGCHATLAPEETRKCPGVTDVLTDKADLPDFLARLGAVKLPTGISEFEERHRAYVKIQDGCRVGCSYCIIPKVRSVLRSRSADAIEREVSELATNGYGEIVLTGIHLGHYGIDREDPSFRLADLLHRLVSLPVAVRYRLGSLEAVEVSDSLLSVVAENPDRICPHFHLSMQSGDDSVLKRMKRRWMSTPYMEKCEQIRSRLPNVALTTDVIVGFPGETEEQFQRTRSVVERLRFSKVHLFRFSPRPGTEAASFSDQIPESVKRDRLARLQEVSSHLREEYAQEQLGKTLSVLIESVSEEGACGTSENYLPVHCSGIKTVPGRIVPLVISGHKKELLFSDHNSTDSSCTS